MSSRNPPNCHCERSVAISSPPRRPSPRAVASPAPPPLHIVRPLREPPNVIAKPAQLSLRAQRGNLVAAAPTLPASRRITGPIPTTLAEKLLTSTPSPNERPSCNLYTSQTGGPQPDVETSYTLRRPHSPAPGNDRSARLNITSGISGQQSRFNGLKPLRAPACGASDCNSLPRILSPSYSTERVRGGAAGVTSAPCRLSRLPRKPGHGSLALESRRQRSQAVAPTTWTPRPDPRCSTLTDTHQP